MPPLLLFGSRRRGRSSLWYAVGNGVVPGRVYACRRVVGISETFAAIQFVICCTAVKGAKNHQLPISPCYDRGVGNFTCLKAKQDAGLDQFAGVGPLLEVILDNRIYVVFIGRGLFGYTVFQRILRKYDALEQKRKEQENTNK